MLNQNVLAQLHLSAVLQNIEDLVEFDQESGRIVKDWNHVMQFSCPGGIGAHIEFAQGRARVYRGTTSLPGVALWFPTATLLNNMFKGEGFTLPIPWSGAWKVSLLKGFTELSKRLEHYLKPSEATLKDRANFEFHVGCLLNTAIFGLKAVGEGDDHVVKYTKAIRDGIAEFSVKNGPAAHIVVKNGKLFPFKGRATQPSAVMELKDFETAYGLFTGALDAMALVGAGDLRITGFVPIIDNLNAALDRLPIYLN